jgi:hypothetical protein
MATTTALDTVVVAVKRSIVCPRCGSASHRCKTGDPGCRHCDDLHCAHQWRATPDEESAVFVPDRKPRKRKTYVDVFFQDSIVGSMLRTLHVCGSMTQADFMSLYHKRCARDNPSRSSFGANFGRYVKREQMYDRWRDNASSLGCLEQRRWAASTAKLRTNTITWIGRSVAEMIGPLDDRAIDRAENAMERIYTRDDDSESLAYLMVLRMEIRARSKS